MPGGAWRARRMKGANRARETARGLSAVGALAEGAARCCGRGRILRSGATRTGGSLLRGRQGSSDSGKGGRPGSSPLAVTQTMLMCDRDSDEVSVSVCARPSRSWCATATVRDRAPCPSHAASQNPTSSAAASRSLRQCTHCAPDARSLPGPVGAIHLSRTPIQPPPPPMEVQGLRQASESQGSQALPARSPRDR